MSLNVPAAVLDVAADGPVPDEVFAAVVRDSLPYPWAVVEQLSAELRAGDGTPVEHAVPPAGDGEFGQLLRAMASDSIRACLEREFGLRLAFQNCHKIGAFLPADDGGPAHAEFVSPRAQLLNQSPLLLNC